jgi:hypothetical protein
MNYKVLFKKRITDEEEYSLGVYDSETLASVVAKGEYYYRGGCTPEYRFESSNEESQDIPEYLYPTLIQVVGFLTAEEQEVFRDRHINFLSKSGLLTRSVVLI